MSNLKAWVVHRAQREE